ncbi:sodium:solute symporter [Pikeienuella piscinae]|uniref:histidine kinase n=1 Tax=Pikeienuella piscinae TaxID=2748098 RepID=A0A7L5BT09_9RHOB|nr:sensor histidine kinase [Pikeienuella piscinae]QIE54605.1 sodium:solute symporter [Pikeienuella piscinae]
MTFGVDMILPVSFGYVALLFLLAWWVDRRAARGGVAWLRSPLTYTLSLSVYCTAWTFYGAVGAATRKGLEFAPIYLGPTLVFIGWWWLIRKLVRIGRTHRITSIADMISSRYGKSRALAAFATVVAVTATTPYIALQLQSLTLSYEVITGGDPSQDRKIAFVAALGLGLFTILFGTRSLDENERHYGVVAAIAMEAVVKLAAVIAVGLYAVFSVAGGVEATFAGTTAESLNLDQTFGPRWMTLLFLSAAAIICLPRQFQVTVVENTDERHLLTASWMFPTYMLLMSLFILPIAAIGVGAAPAGANPDLFVLTLPLNRGDNELAIFAFIGGLSAATSMVIVSTIALSTMVSNHIVAPLSVRLMSEAGSERSGDVKSALLTSRRVAILGILSLGYAYFSVAGRSDALAATGLIAFCGVAQFLPALLAGVFWRGATRTGAAAGLTLGFALWLWTLFLPSFGGDVALPASVLADGPFGIGLLRPYALFGSPGADPLVHATVWSLGVNATALVLVSLMSRMSPLERLQGALFVDVFRAEPLRAFSLVRRSAASSDLYILAQRILGTSEATAVFRGAAARQGKATGLPDPTPFFISGLERRLAGSVGAASAHAMVNRIAGGEKISMAELVDMADENAKLRRATEALRAKSAEAEQTARQLRAANEQLKTLDARKDEFLSQVSHELRTPMTSVRSFAEILERNPGLDAAQRGRFAGIIQTESLRLTRLLDEIRDLSFLDDPLPAERRPIDAEAALASAIEISLAPHEKTSVNLKWENRAGDAVIEADPDRLTQVFINLISNAIIHNDKPVAEIEIRTAKDGREYRVDVIDNGPGVAPRDRDRIFETFFRRSTRGSAGLGLPICRKFMTLFKGSIELAPESGGGAHFILRAPLAGTRG